LAAAANWSIGVEKLLLGGADALAKDSQDLFPLHHAIFSGCIESVRLLLDMDCAQYVKGSNVTLLSTDRKGCPSVVEASIYASTEIQDAVLEALAMRQHAFRDYSIFHDILAYSSFEKRISLAEKAISAGFRGIDKHDPDGLNPLMKSLLYGSKKWASFFLKKGSNPWKKHPTFELATGHFLCGLLDSYECDYDDDMVTIGQVWLTQHPKYMANWFQCPCSTNGYSFLTSILTFSRQWDTNTLGRLRRLRNLLSLNWIPLFEAHEYYRAFVRVELFERLGMTHTCTRISNSWMAIDIRELDPEDIVEIQEEESDFIARLDKLMSRYDRAVSEYQGQLWDFHIQYLKDLDKEEDLRIVRTVHLE
jgi:hypothetical protein